MKWVLVFSLFLSSLCFAQTKATRNLFKAIEKNNLDLAISAIRDGADVNGVENINSPTTTVLIKAVKLNRAEMVELLLEHKADPDQRRPIDLHTGLMIAASLDEAPIAKLFLKHGADVNLFTAAMRTALHVAALHNSLEVAKLLLETKDIDVNFKSSTGLCPLAVAVQQGNTSMVKLLKIQVGAKAVSPDCLERAQKELELSENKFISQILERK